MTLKNKVVHCKTQDIASRILAMAVNEQIIDIKEANDLYNTWGVLSGLSWYTGTKDTKSLERRFQKSLGGLDTTLLNKAKALILQ